MTRTDKGSEQPLQEFGVTVRRLQGPVPLPQEALPGPEVAGGMQGRPLEGARRRNRQKERGRGSK